MSLQLIERKKKVIVRRLGHPVFDYPINTAQLSCACSRNKMCEHVLFYLRHKGVRASVIPYLKIPHIRNKIREERITDGSAINQLCLDFLRNEDDGCRICLHSFLDPDEPVPKSVEEKFHMCIQCRNIVHLGCHHSWNKGCTICMRGHPEPKKDSYGIAEEFPALS